LVGGSRQNHRSIRLGEPLDREGRNEAVNVLGSSRNVFAGLAHV